MKGGEESMLEEDSLLLECLEDIYLNFEIIHYTVWTSKNKLDFLIYLY